MGNAIGGGGGLLSAIGGIVGTVFGGPIGAMIGQMIGGVLDQALSGAMNNNGIDQNTQDQAQTAYRDAFRQASGGLDPTGGSGSLRDQVDQFADATNASPADRGRLQQLTDELQQLVNDAVARGSAEAAGGQEARDTKGGKGEGGSWLMAIAKALGGTAGQAAARMVKLSDELAELGDKKAGLADSKDTKAKEQAASDYNQKQVEFQGASQEFTLLMNTISTAIKSLGESLTTMARKQ
ncbi:hypothetical protein [Dokdonella ginsengisoli]|uniref:Uncharacterized protein n=1 Tax=Dokdonella ginsengisoli TaxID=363846 RepID=A0ABV9QXP0_9GAMM